MSTNRISVDFGIALICNKRGWDASPGVYKHYKGGHYHVLGWCLDSDAKILVEGTDQNDKPVSEVLDDLSSMRVLYFSLDTRIIWRRKPESFFAPVTAEEWTKVGGVGVPPPRYQFQVAFREGRVESELMRLR